MKPYVLDTNVLINRQRDLRLGETKEEVVNKFITLCKKVGGLSLYTTPDALEELSSFFENEASLFEKLRVLFTVQSPPLGDQTVSSLLFAKLVEESGKRLYRGMRITEEIIRMVIQEKTTEKAPLEEKYISLLRKKYRDATREGFIDSTVDYHLIQLALYKEAVLVTSDKGLITWCRYFGVPEASPEMFLQQITSQD